MKKTDPSLWLNEYGDYLYNYAYSRVNDSMLAEDLIQDTFLSAVRAKDGFEGRSAVKTWLVAILKRKIIDHYRKSYWKKEIKVLDSLDTYQKESLLKEQWEHNQNMAEWESKEFIEILTKSIAMLPPKMSTVFSMREIDGYSTEEICEHLNITPSNLWVLMHRAKSHLKKSIEKKWLQPYLQVM